MLRGGRATAWRCFGRVWLSCSETVNITAVHEIDRWVDGGVLVRLKDEKKTELPVARDRVRELKRRLGI